MTKLIDSKKLSVFIFGRVLGICVTVPVIQLALADNEPQKIDDQNVGSILGSGVDEIVSGSIIKKEYPVDILQQEKIDREFVDEFLMYKGYIYKHLNTDRYEFDTNVLVNSVRPEKDPRQHRLNYAYSKLHSIEFVKTLYCENRRLDVKTKSPNNEYGVGQFLYSQHSSFINSKWFLNSYNQIDYATNVWLDWELRTKKNGSLNPFRAYYQVLNGDCGNTISFIK